MSGVDYNFKQVIVVRVDLKLSKGKLAVEVAHASISSYINTLNTHKEWVFKWLEEGQPKIVCKVKNLEELLNVYKKAISMNIPAVIIRDAGKTEIPPNTVTCVGIGPAPVEIIDKVTGELPLL